MRTLLLAATLLCGAATPTLACINDRDVDLSEREFRLRYEDEPRDERLPLHALEASAGLALLLAGALVVRARRAS